MNYFEKMDAVILAGTHLEKDKLIYGQNKAFLDFHGKAVVQWVIEALGAARRINRFVVVGPREKLAVVHEKSPVDFIPVEQKGQMITNAWIAFHALCPQGNHYSTDFLEFQAAQEQGTLVHPPDIDFEKPYLFISGDIPLAVPEAIDHFIERCSQLPPQDMYYGISSEESLKPYYPTHERIGIKRPYANFSDGRYRLANIQIVKPLKLGRLFLVQSGYSVRKLTMWRNVFRLIKIIIRLPYGLRAASYVARLQTTMLLFKYGLQKWAGPIVRRTRREKLEWYLSNFLQTRVRIVNTPFGGLSVDIDDADDFEILKTHFPEWLKLQQQLADSLRDQPSS
jgi:hypothetical protein